MVEVRFDKRFKVVFSKLKDDVLRKRVARQIKKMTENPKAGKPMRNIRKGTRELYIPPFRLSYFYYMSKDVIYILDLYHKKFQ